MVTKQSIIIHKNVGLEINSSNGQLGKVRR